MTEAKAPLDQLEAESKQQLEQAATAAQLETWRVQWLGRKGQLPLLLRGVKDLPEVKRRLIGQRANELRRELEAAYEVKQRALGEPVAGANLEAKNRLDHPGHMHPLTLTSRRIQEIFAAMGFTIMEGPEVEDIPHSFDYLNIPPEHPARSESDTFYLTSGEVLRTQTSSMQVRATREHGFTPPFRLLFPGRVFRSERTDATHETIFHQFEGLHIGEAVTIADFKGVIATFFSAFFGQAATIRLRPSYFPFVEPGFEVDISCIFCGQKGCRLCKQSGWIEVMGAGMVHPNVLKSMKIDAAHWQGYAFGGAIDRLTMLRYGITDIRLFWSGDIRFLQQF